MTDGAAARRESAVALVSGGLDSVVSLALANRELEVRLVLFCNYGQRALTRERSSVVDVAGYYGLPLQEVDVSWLCDLSPEGMRQTAPSGRGGLVSLDSVWIPNRNGLFLNIAAAYAERYGCQTVVTGFNREEAAEFPDNSAGFVDAVNRGLEFSTRNGVRVVSYTLEMSKREIIEAGGDAGVPFDTIWSCYRAGERMCGDCASCRRLRSALDSLPGDRRPPIEFEE